MNYLMFIERIAQCGSAVPEIRFLVSGSDKQVRARVLQDVLEKCRRGNENLVIVDDTGSRDRTVCHMLQSFGYGIKDGLSGNFCLYDPFQITTVRGISRIRQLFSVLGYDERQKGKLIAYLNFIRHIEYLEHGSHEIELSLEKLGVYGTVMEVEEKLQYLAGAGVIDERQQMMLLARYSECAQAAADLEDAFIVLRPFASGERVRFGANTAQAMFFPTGEFGEDETLRSLVMQMIRFGLEENTGSKTALLVFDRGYGNRKCVFELLKSLPPQVNTNVFSEDIFTLCGPEALAAILNRFPARIYSRHPAMRSAEAVEKLCGEIDVVKNSYNVSYDRRWRANSPWDMLMGNNKTEVYTQNAPVREPRYRKEMIMGFPAGNGIVEYLGNTSMFSA